MNLEKSKIVRNVKGNTQPEVRLMSDFHEERIRLVQTGLAIKGAMTALNITLSKLAPEIGHSQGYLSRVLATYCTLDINVCENIIERFIAALGKRGATFDERKNEIEISFYRPDVAPLGRLYHGAIVGAGCTYSDMAEKLNLSQATLSRVFNTYAGPEIHVRSDRVVNAVADALSEKSIELQIRAKTLHIILNRHAMKFHVGPPKPTN